MMFISLVTDIQEVRRITKPGAHRNDRPSGRSPTPNIEIWKHKNFPDKFLSKYCV